MSTLNARFDELRELLDDADSVVVSGHERADGDAVGAVAALRRHLELQDKSVTAILLEPLSQRYGFMEFAQHYSVFDPEQHRELVRDADVFVMCDLSSMSRLGGLAEAVAAGTAKTVCVDHHPCEDEGPADLNLLQSTATATGRIVWDYIQHVEGEVDREIAESVFVSLCSDTGWFRYANTDADVMTLAAELAGYRLDLHEIHRSIYQSNSSAMLRLLGHVTRSMNEECDGRFLWTIVRREFIADLGVDRLDTDPILDVMRSAGGVTVVALFTELADGSVNVSLRSRGDPDVNIVARRFGGGGHTFAAGATLPADSAEKDVRQLVAELRRCLRED